MYMLSKYISSKIKINIIYYYSIFKKEASGNPVGKNNLYT